MRCAGHAASGAGAAGARGPGRRVGAAHACPYNPGIVAPSRRFALHRPSLLAPVPVDRVVRVLGPADYRTMPWKNGGGRTTEIAAAPRGADLAGFTWRISVAELERDGPFSAFPGVDRTLVLLAGNGMRLTGPQCD